MIVQIHGFNSAGGGEKARKLKSMFPNVKVVSPSYICEDFSTIESLLSGVDIIEKPLFIGTSLGGYIALYLAKKYDAPAILLNPAINPEQTLKKYLGVNTNFVTGESYEFMEENIKQLDQYRVNDFSGMDVSVFVTKDDDLLDYSETVKCFDGIFPVTVLEEGGHRFGDLDVISDVVFQKLKVNYT